jgi:hypothetical protein
VTVGAIDQIRPAPPSSSAPKGGEAAGKTGVAFAETYKGSSSAEERDIFDTAGPAAAPIANEGAEDGDKNVDHGHDPGGVKQSDWPMPEDGQPNTGQNKEITFPTLAQAWVSAPPSRATESPEPETSVPPVRGQGHSTDLLSGTEKGAILGKTDAPPVQKPDAAVPLTTGIPSDSIKAGETTAGGLGPAGQERPADRREAAHHFVAVKTPPSASSLKPENAVAPAAATALPKSQAVSDPSHSDAPIFKRLDGSGPQVQASSPPPSPYAISAPPIPMPASGAALLLWGKLSPTQTIDIEGGLATGGLSANTSHPATGPTAAQQPSAPIPYQAIPAKLAEMSRNGQTGPVELSLAPEELGRVRMQILLDGDTVRIVLQAERAETAELLRRNGDALLSELRQSGFEDASFSFTGWGAGGQSDKQERFAGENPEPTATAPNGVAFQKPPAAPVHTLSLGLNLRL